MAVRCDGRSFRGMPENRGAHVNPQFLQRVVKTRTNPPLLGDNDSLEILICFCWGCFCCRILGLGRLQPAKRKRFVRFWRRLFSWRFFSCIDTY